MHQELGSDRLQQRVFEVLISFGAEEGSMSREATLEGLDIDSLDLVELGQIVEDEFGVKLQPDEFQGVDTVADAIDVIRGHLDESAGS
jgi:acyl carrier protein